ncbi:MAG: DoxX family protein [Akkermansiaceae bacterium]|jgi:putative oxidoreductase|nr:DoxX family protein [Akkermansiaceae bacterium]
MMKLQRLISTWAGLEPSLQSSVLLLVRVSMGWGFFLTGKGKLIHLERTTRYFDSLELPLPKLQAMLAGGTETVGGVLLIAGLGTRIISVPLAFTMGVAYLTAHRDEAFVSLSDFTDQAPFPFLMAVLVTFAFGAGKFSIDRLLQPWFERIQGNHRPEP